MSAANITEAALAARRTLVLIEAIDAWNDVYKGVEMNREDLALLLEMLQAEAHDVTAHLADVDGASEVGQ